MRFKLRDYQQECVDKVLWSWNNLKDGNDLCVLPTGAGKSIVIASIADSIGGDILVLQPSKEILEQNYSKMLQYVSPEEVGIYSASAGQKEIKRITLATIGSIKSKIKEFSHFKLVIIDEAHLVNPKRAGSMYGQFIKAIGNPRVFGLTATPYRMDTWYAKDAYGLRAYVCIKLVNRMRPMFWNRMLYVLNAKRLFDNGYLSTPEYINKEIIPLERLRLNKSGSDFDLANYEKQLSSKDSEVVDAIEYGLSISKHVLVFVSSKNRAEKLNSLVRNSEYVTSDTPKKERERILENFKNGKIKTVFNVGVLTTGFDFPELDCIILGRPTKSLALYYQMLGRGVRIAEGKESCKIIDLTGTVNALGKLETIEVKKDEENKWEIFTETGRWHTAELYSYSISK